MFYDRFEELCTRKGVKPGRACSEMGLSRSLAAKWKKTGTERPSAEVLEKMSAYFGMSINEILGIEKAPPVNGDAEWVEIMSRTEFRQLFHAMRNSSREEILAIATAWNARKNRGDND